ncbi:MULTISPECIES: sensor histidine kinase [Myxococcus]|uniref:sensor histidine kinase n=1 Tax=Myxococcus TaxID=32 RepID=UPI0003223513|nr:MULTISPECIES: HAMP domain-containing sensor histidine kinase [Myxococcus]NOJ53965.1 HAMP domain-containing histidine kinase [Myxococcus xanthus]QPM76768.1 HAMP domain-containing histidine kinase [Myxococcus xanthus]QVW65835.1 HAMP domain-containing histidine kinase [Myxococcus xanthus DZ2]QZZ51851.1 Adaptive-response sensory-kinase SasA [Myxococcus xanthus]UEO08033.1 HAMP domain-containing histidine kinase [Myxococcus xanthus DZ2]
MALAIGSPSPERRARPRLWLVFAAVGVAGFALTLAGLAFVRVYDNQLIRQTESELIAQGAVVAEVFRERLRATVPEGAYGRERTAPWPFPIPDDTRLRPILPSLRASDASLPPGDTPRPSRVPAEPLSHAAGLQLTPLLEQVRAATLAGIRVVDTEGVVVASSSSALLWTTLADRTEVQRALRGEPVSVLRRRVADPEDTPLASLSRDTGIRVTVALPVLEGDRVWGAVVLTRTPMTFAKATYADRWNLTATGFVLLGAVALMSLAAAALVGRPVRALVKQTRAIAMSDPSGFEPMARPVVAELAELSESLAGMATALRDRNQYIRSFAANVSHEFKTPLASIQGAVELLRDSADAMSPEQRARFLANVDADARRLTRLVQRLLELARADSMTATPAQVELGPLLEGLALRARADGATAIHVTAPPAGLKVSLPQEVLDDVLWQLVTNARQHGGDTVRVDLSVEQAPEADLVRVVVKDRGKGISESNRARIFDAFFTTARERGGTGLGLTIAQSMLRAFHARLELLPSDTGTTFAVVAPVPRLQRK